MIVRKDSWQKYESFGQARTGQTRLARGEVQVDEPFSPSAQTLMSDASASSQAQYNSLDRAAEGPEQRMSESGERVPASEAGISSGMICSYVY